VVVATGISGFSTRTDPVGIWQPPWGIWAVQSAREPRYRARYAPIAIMSGLMPTMFITLVSLAGKCARLP
jgi:hypothetical protein